MTVKRLRGSQLCKLREQWFHEHPLCVLCLKADRITAATELDHIVPLHKHGKDDDSNRQGLCRECHLKKSKQERGHTYIRRVTVGVDGWPES